VRLVERAHAGGVDPRKLDAALALIRRAYDRYTGGVAIELDERDFGTGLLADAASRKAIDGCWRSVSPVALVRSVLTQRALLGRAAAGVLDPEEQQLILRPRANADAWTAADLPLLDEAEFYVGKPLPSKLKLALDANDASLEAQKSLVQNQQAEIVRINALYDAELARLRKLWAGAPAGSLGGPPSASAPANGPATTRTGTK